MKHLYRLVVIGIVSIGVSATPFLTRAAAPTIFISEVSWAGSSLSASDEFIELYNASGETISLTDWSLHGAATSGEALALPKDTAIPPYSTYLIANYDINEDNSALLSAPDLATPQLALPNTKLSVALVDARGTVLDRVGTGIGSPPAGSAGVSLMRVDASADGASDEAWAAASVSLGFKTGLTDLGTPGAHDGMKTQEAEAGEEVSEPASASEAKTNVEVISESEPASETGVEASTKVALSATKAISTPDPIQVHPSQDDVITVIYRGFVFELNLPKQNIVESLSSTTTSIEAPNVPATNNVVQTVSPPTSELAKLMASAAESASASDIKTETVPEEPEPTIPAMSLQTLRFSEIYPNTVGNDEEEEYIEIENFGNAPVDLLGWSIQDAAEKIWTADGSFKLKAGEVVALPRVLTKIVLNNNEETLTLTHPNRQVIDVISYGKAEKGATYTRAGNAWSWQSPTPNIVETAAGAEATGTLVVPDVVVSAAAATPLSASSSTSEPSMAIVLKATEETMSLDEAEESPDKASASKPAALPGFRAMSIAQARAFDLGTSVRVEGVVTALPGIFASQSFYMEGGENTQSRAGVQVYLHSADFPPLALGDRIRVSGVTSQNRGEARIKLSGREAIEVLGSEPADAQDIRLDTVGEATEARLVTVEALVESARSDEMTLVEGEATLRVASRERTGVSFAAIPSGSRVRVTGIVSELNGTYTLLPRSQSDISIVEMPANENPVAAGIVNASKPPTGLYGGLLLLGMLATLGFWIARSRKDQDLTLTNA